MTEIVLTLGEGYDPAAVPTVMVDVYGKRYRARKPKTTAGLAVADFQMRMWELREIGQSASSADDGGDTGALVETMREKTAEVRSGVRDLALSMFDEADADDLVERIFDQSRENHAVDLDVVTRLQEMVQAHFAEETAEEFEQVGMEPPEPVKKAVAKKTAGKKTAAKKTAAKKTTAKRKAAARR